MTICRGDLGASVGPQLVGVITDAVSASPRALEVAIKMSLTPEQLGMKCGILVGFVFSLAAVVTFLVIMRRQRIFLEK